MTDKTQQQVTAEEADRIVEKEDVMVNEDSVRNLSKSD